MFSLEKFSKEVFRYRGKAGEHGTGFQTISSVETRRVDTRCAESALEVLFLKVTVQICFRIPHASKGL